MLKVFRVLLFSLSLFFIGAHTLAPHNHQSSQTYRCTDLPSWLDFLADIVSFDLGQEHLEEYLPVGMNEELSGDSTFEYILPKIYQIAIVSFILQKDTNRSLLPDIPFLTTYFYTTFSFRGPPQPSCFIV